MPRTRRRKAKVILVGRPGIFTTFINGANYTSYVYSWNVKKRLNALSTFEVTMMGIDSAAKADVDEGKEIQFNAETYLILKGKIEKVLHTSDYFTKISGYCMARKLMRYLTDRVTYTNTDSSEIVKKLCSVNNDGQSPWIMEVNENDNFGEVTARYEYDNKLRALTSLAKYLNYDWFITHSTDRTTDYFNMSSREGSASSVKTFQVTGVNQNAELTSQQIDLDGVINSCHLLGMGDGEEQLHSHYFRGSTDRTTLDVPMDTFLTSSITSDDTTLEVVDTSGFPSSGTVQIDKEQITYTGTTSTTFTGCTRGANSTNKVEHPNHSEVINISGTIIVNSTTGFPSSGRIRVGEEEITYTGTTTTTFTGCSRTRDLTSTATSGTSTTLTDSTQSWLTNEWDGGTVYITEGTGSGQSREVLSNTSTTLTISTWTTTPDSTSRYFLTRKVYAHGKNIKVYCVYDGTNTWSVNNPESGSSIDTYGLYNVVKTDTSIVDQNALDFMAQSVVEDYYSPVKRIKVKPIDALSDIQVVDIGDTITLTDAQSDLDGTYRVIGYEIGRDENGYEYLVYEVSNQFTSFVEEIEDTKKEIGDLSKYTQGSMVYYPFSIQTNLDYDIPAYVRLQIPDDVVSINDAKLTLFVSKYRVDSTVSDKGSAHSHNITGKTTGGETGGAHTHGIPELSVNSTTALATYTPGSSASNSASNASSVDVTAPTISSGYATSYRMWIQYDPGSTITTIWYYIWDDTDDVYVYKPTNGFKSGAITDYLYDITYEKKYRGGHTMHFAAVDEYGEALTVSYIKLEVTSHGGHSHTVSGTSTASSTTGTGAHSHSIDGIATDTESEHTHDLVMAVGEDSTNFESKITVKVAQGAYDKSSASTANWTTIGTYTSSSNKDIDISAPLSKGIHTLEFSHPTSGKNARIEAFGYIKMKVKV